MSNSNFNITKVTVDPVSQEITNLEVNGKEINTGGGEVQEKVISILNVSSLFPDSGEESDSVIIEPDEGYDAMGSVAIQNVTGYPTYDKYVTGLFVNPEDSTDTILFAFKYPSNPRMGHIGYQIDSTKDPLYWIKVGNEGRWDVFEDTSIIVSQDGKVTVEELDGENKTYENEGDNFLSVLYLPHED